MSAPAARLDPNTELDPVGAFVVAWPRRKCTLCGRPTPQAHGQALLTSDELPLCVRCYLAARSLGSLNAARRVVRAN